MSLPQMGMSSGISVIEVVLCYDSTELSLQISYIISAIAFSYGHTYKTLFLFNVSQSTFVSVVLTHI